MVSAVERIKMSKMGLSSQGVYSLVGDRLFLNIFFKQLQAIFEFGYFLLLYFLRLNWLRPKEKMRVAYENASGVQPCWHPWKTHTCSVGFSCVIPTCGFQLYLHRSESQDNTESILKNPLQILMTWMNNAASYCLSMLKFLPQVELSFCISETHFLCYLSSQVAIVS